MFATEIERLDIKLIVEISAVVSFVVFTIFVMYRVELKSYQYRLNADISRLNISKLNTSKLNIKQTIDCHYLIIIDWDDTLIPTTKLDDFYDFEEKRYIKPSQDFAKVGIHIYNLLRTLLHVYGSSSIKIVTNSLNGWVMDSLDICHNISSSFSFQSDFKNIKQLLIENNIEIISARSRYSSLYPEWRYAPIWKKLTFENILKQKSTNEFTKTQDIINIISIGDDYTNDHYALHAALLNNNYYDKYKNIYHHQIKLRNHESIYNVKDCDHFIFQLKYINQLLKYKYHSEISLSKRFD